MTAERGEAVSTREEFLNCLTIAKWSVLKPYTQKQTNTKYTASYVYLFYASTYLICRSVYLFIYVTILIKE